MGTDDHAEPAVRFLVKADPTFLERSALVIVDDPPERVLAGPGVAAEGPGRTVSDAEIAVAALGNHGGAVGRQRRIGQDCCPRQFRAVLPGDDETVLPDPSKSRARGGGLVADEMIELRDVLALDPVGVGRYREAPVSVSAEPSLGQLLEPPEM